MLQTSLLALVFWVSFLLCTRGTCEVGSITSHCSGNEHTILPGRHRWTHGFAIVDFHQSDHCLLKLNRQHKFIFLEQMSNGGYRGFVWCKVRSCYRAFKLKTLNYCQKKALEKQVNGKDVFCNSTNWIWIINHFPVCTNGCWQVMCKRWLSSPFLL